MPSPPAQDAAATAYDAFLPDAFACLPQRYFTIYDDTCQPYYLLQLVARAATSRTRAAMMRERVMARQERSRLRAQRMRKIRVSWRAARKDTRERAARRCSRDDAPAAILPAKRQRKKRGYAIRDAPARLCVMPHERCRSMASASCMMRRCEARQMRCHLPHTRPHHHYFLAKINSTC